MPLAAATVVDHIATRLRGATAAGQRVFTSRLWPITDAELPAWRVVAGDEPVDYSTMSGLNRHSLTVQVTGLVRATADVDDAMHALAAQAMPLIFTAPNPYGLQLDRISRDTPSDGEAALGAITLTVAATYYADPTAPETILSA